MKTKLREYRSTGLDRIQRILSWPKRQDWLTRFGDPLRPRPPKPFDRDRFLPSIERKAGLSEEDA